MLIDKPVLGCLLRMCQLPSHLLNAGRRRDEFASMLLGDMNRTMPLNSSNMQQLI